MTGIRRRLHHAMQHNATQSTGCSPRVSAHYLQNCTDEIWLYPWPITSVFPWSLYTGRLHCLPLPASLCRPRGQTWSCHVGYSDGVLLSTVLLHPILFGTSCHLISNPQGQKHQSRTVQVRS